MDGLNIDQHINNEGQYDCITKPVERVDEIVREDVLVMKVWAAAEGAKP